MACAKMFTYHAIILTSYHLLYLKVQSRYETIIAPEIATLYNMIRPLDFTNKIFKLQISTGTL